MLNALITKWPGRGIHKKIRLLRCYAPPRAINARRTAIRVERDCPSILSRNKSRIRKVLPNKELFIR